MTPILEFPSRKAITGVQTSPAVDISRHSNGRISVVREATVRWWGTLIVLHVLSMLIWLDPIQGQCREISTPWPWIGSSHINMLNTCRTISMPHHLTVASRTTEIRPFECREISTAGDQDHGAFKFPKIVIVIAGRPQEAMHAVANDHHPPCRAFLLDSPN